MQAKLRRTIVVIGLALGLLTGAIVQAQDQSTGFGRVTQTAETVEEAQPFTLGTLQVGDEVTVHIQRISGDLIPYAAIYNQSRTRYAIRWNANTDDQARLDNTYTIEQDAGDGDYTLRVTSDLTHPTTGDFIVTYQVKRGTTVLTQPLANAVPHPPDYQQPIILIEDGTSATGAITNSAVQISYLVYLDVTNPLTFTVTTTDGNLVPFFGISLADQEQFFLRASAEANANTISADFPPPDQKDLKSGYYLIAVSRVDFQDGTTTGHFVLTMTPAKSKSAG